MKIDKHFLIALAGFVWGLSGFVVEVSDSPTVQFILRTFLVVLPAFLLLSVLPFKIKRNYHLPYFLFFTFFAIYLAICIAKGISITSVGKYTVLLITITTIYVLLSNQRYVINFLRGLLTTFVILLVYYFISIDFTNFFAPFYRLFTGLNPNGIGNISVMAFILSYYNLFSRENRKEKLFLFTIAMMSIIIVLATRSRTALIMLFAAFFFISFILKKKKIILVSIAFLMVLAVYKQDAIIQIFRLEQSSGYKGPNSIYNLTGRTDLWGKGIHVIEDNFLFGVGEEKAFVTVDEHKGTYHNAFIQMLVTVGFIGFLPILILLFFAIRNIFIIKNGILVKTIFLVGLMGSMAESRLLNYGSPGNLLYLFSLLILGTNKFDKELLDENID